MHIVKHAEQQLASMPGLEHMTLAGADEGLRALSVWRQSIAGGAATPPHRHDCEEVVVVVAGRGEIHCEREVWTFEAPATLSIPRNVPHQILNTGDAPLELIAAFSATPVEVYFPDGEPLPLPWRS